MPTQTSVAELAQKLHDKKILNLDSSLKDSLSIESSVLSGADKVADWNIVGGSHYVVVTGLGGLGAAANPAAISKTMGKE